MAYLVIAGKRVRLVGDVMYLAPSRDWTKDKNEALAILDREVAHLALTFASHNPVFKASPKNPWQVWIEEF